MPMLFLIQQYQKVVLTMLKNFSRKIFGFPLDVGWGRVAIGIFYPSGKPILLGGWGGCFVAIHLRYTCTAAWTDASHLQQARLVNNPGNKKK
jgi:hypothetical protein